MASYHFTTKPVSRGAGRSATAAAAYRAGARIVDHSTEQTFDYSRKRGVEHAEIVLPTVAAQRDIHWVRNRQALWNAAEQAEKRKDARVAREYELALPHELTKVQRVALVRAFAHELAERYGVAVDFALHQPHRSGDQRNYHAHVMTTTRQVEPTGLGAKAAIEWSDQDRGKKGLMPAKEELKEVLRKRWEVLTNEHLRAQGLSIRVDCRSLAAQGIDRTPTTHLGPAVSGMERRGIETEVGLRIREQQRAELQRRLERAAEAGRLERESRQVQQSILDVRSTLHAAIKERDSPLAGERVAKPPSLEEVRRRAREAWLEMRQAQQARQAEHEKTMAREIEPVLPAGRRTGLRQQRLRDWDAGLMTKPPELQAQVAAAIAQRLRADRGARIDEVLAKAQQRYERRVSQVREWAGQEPEPPTGIFGALGRRAYQDRHRAWSGRERELRSLSDQAQRQRRQLEKARQPFELQRHAGVILQRDAPQLLERVRAYQHDLQQRERQRSREQAREKDLGRDLER